MSDYVVALLGSSVLSVMITSLFNWIQNRRSNTLNYIAEEKKKRREAIREIIAGVDKSVYDGKGKRNINQYLVILEMNINPYGRFQKSSYSLDSHLWNVIEEVRLADTEDEFNQKKKLLLSYLYLLLKEDWEKMKREVSGYSNAICNIGLIGAMSIGYSLFYLYILKLDNIVLLLAMLFFNCSPLLFTKLYLFEELESIESKNKGISINAILKKNKKWIKIFVIYMIYIFFFLFFNLYVVNSIYPKMIMKHIEYETKDDMVYIYTKLDNRIWHKLEEQIHTAMEENEVIIVRNQNVSLSINERSKENDEILIKVIKSNMSLFSDMLFTFLIINLMIEMYFLFSSDIKSRRMENEVRRLTHSIDVSDKEMYNQLIVILGKLDYSEKRNEVNNKEYLGLLYVILEELERIIKKEVSDMEGDIRSVEAFEKMKAKKDCLEVIKHAFKGIKAINKAAELEVKRERKLELEQKINHIVKQS